MYKAYALKDEWSVIFQTLPNEKAGMLIKAIYDIEQEPNFKDSEPILYAIFAMMQDYIIRESPKISDIIFDNKRARTCSQYKYFRNSVLKRDNYKCIKCGSELELNVHHIKAFAKYPKLRFEVSNGVTLCKSCHRKVHRNEK